MKFKDLRLGIVLETNNEFVINQYKNNADRYKEVKPKAKKVAKEK